MKRDKMSAINVKTNGAPEKVRLKNPGKVPDSSVKSGQMVTWDCVWFGSYPQREVVADESVYNAVFRGDGRTVGYYNRETDIIEDAELFSELESAAGWDAGGDIVIGGSRYRRVSIYRGEEKKYAAHPPAIPVTAHSGQYNWNRNCDFSYHYFKYEPIKWRVLHVNGCDALLLADMALDSREFSARPAYDITPADNTWENSTIRSWLNGYGRSENIYGTDYTDSNFAQTAFAPAEISAVKAADAVNKSDNAICEPPESENKGGSALCMIGDAENKENAAPCTDNSCRQNCLPGRDMNPVSGDRIFLLSRSEAEGTAEAESYGFAEDIGLCDEGKICRSSTYAKAMGAESAAGGACSWWLRSPGRDIDLVSDVDSTGVVDCLGAYAENFGDAVRPALHLDISRTNLWSYAGTVCSDGTVTCR
jgi:hypothetical protein